MPNVFEEFPSKSEDDGEAAAKKAMADAGVQDFMISISMDAMKDAGISFKKGPARDQFTDPDPYTEVNFPKD